MSPKAGIGNVLLGFDMILGYGEDALTFWLLAMHLQDLLVILDDTAKADDCVAFFRPSFGRRASKWKDAVAIIPRASFGEFDAIIGSPSAVYLIECKWTRSGEARGPYVTLRPEQLRRHQVMRAYLEEWRAQEPASWKQFLEKSAILERLQALGVSAPKASSRVARTLRVVLRRVSHKNQGSASIVDVLLFFRSENRSASARSGSPPSEVKDAPHFRFVGVDVRNNEFGGFFPLTSLTGHAPMMWRGEKP